MQLFFFSISGDKSSQLLAAKNLLAGHGLTLNGVFLSHLSSESFVPLVGWPPGYSVLLSPLLWLFNNNYKTAALVFDIASLFPFFFYLTRLLNYLLIQPWLKNLFILFAGFYFYPGNAANTCTDFISMTCVLAGFYYLLLFMHKDKTSLSLVLSVSISFFLAGFFRYNYIPVVFCCPILLWVAGFINKKKQWVRGGFQIGFLLGTMLLSLLIFQHFYTGSATYVNTRTTGFFPQNFSKMYPIVPGSYFDVEATLGIFTQLTGGNYSANASVFIYTSYSLFFFLLMYGIRWLWKNKLHLKGSMDYFTFMGLGISMAIIFLLFYFSARNSPILASHYAPWTYIQEIRYFIFILVFIQLITLVYLFNRAEQLSRFWKSVAVFCAFIVFMGFIHHVYYVSKLLLFSNPPFYTSASYATETESIIQLSKDAQNQNPGYEIIVASPDYNICNYAGLENIKAVYNPSPLSLSQQIYSSTPVKLLVIIPKGMASEYNTLPGKQPAYYFGQIQNLYFYMLDVTTKR